MARKPKTLDDALAAVEKKLQAMKQAREKRRRELDRLLEALDDLDARWNDDSGYEADELEMAIDDLREKADELRSKK